MPQLRLVVAVICALDLARFHEHLRRRAVDALLEACQRVSIVSLSAAGAGGCCCWCCCCCCDVPVQDMAGGDEAAGWLAGWGWVGMGVGMGVYACVSDPDDAATTAAALSVGRVHRHKNDDANAFLVGRRPNTTRTRCNAVTTPLPACLAIRRRRLHPPPLHRRPRQNHLLGHPAHRRPPPGQLPGRPATMGQAAG